jgi:hypothetical protein
MDSDRMNNGFKTIFTGVFLLTWIATATAQGIGYQYLNITGQATTLIRTGNGVLHTVCFNKPTATETVAIYDGVSTAGTLIGTITVPASPLPGCLTYDVAYGAGLTIVTGTASSDITVSYR